MDVIIKDYEIIFILLKIYCNNNLQQSLLTVSYNYQKI